MENKKHSLCGAWEEGNRCRYIRKPPVGQRAGGILLYYIMSEIYPKQKQKGSLMDFDEFGVAGDASHPPCFTIVPVDKRSFT